MTEVAPPGEETASTEDILLAEQGRARVEIETEEEDADANSKRRT